MAQSYTTLRSTISVLLQDSTTSGQAASNSLFPTAELDLLMADALRELALYVPHVVAESFTIESRTGTANSDTSSALVDTAESQFVSGDVGKMVHNKTDNTWAVVTAYVSSSQLTLSKDIFPDGNEDYEIFNKDCFNSRQINIVDVIDRVRDPKVAEYPVGAYRNVTMVSNDIIELEVDAVDDSKVLSSGDQPETEVLVYFDKRHKISQLTDFAGAVDLEAGYAAGATSMVIDGLQATGTIEADQEFTIANVRGVYTVTAAATIGTNEATVSFFPGLQSAVVNDVVVTFKSSTLTPELEPLYCDLVAARASMSKARSKIGTVTVGGSNTAAELQDWGNTRLALVLSKLGRMSLRAHHLYPRS